MRGPSLTGLGKRPDLTPAHQVDLATGMGPSGAIMDFNRTKPVVGKEVWFDIGCPRSIDHGANLGRPTNVLDEVG